MEKAQSILIWADENKAQLIQNLLEEQEVSIHKAQNALDFLNLGKVFRGNIVVLDSLLEFQALDELISQLNEHREGMHYLILTQPGINNFHEITSRYRNVELLHEPVDALHLNRRLHQLLGLEEQIQVEQGVSDQELRNPNDYGHLLSLSPKMKEVMMVINQVAPTNIKVLIRGESGTGKELVARTIYARSLRKDKPFIKVLCAALPEGLLESELFGYEKGAFTGALRRKPGKFEFANHGTIFLDEIGEIAPSLQAKLLQVLQDGEFSRVGGETDVKVDTRVLAATNKNLEKGVAQGTFREDLYYRLNVVSVHLPALKERKEELYFLVQYFLDKFNQQYNKNYRKISPETMRLFTEYDWPGNIREMENTIKRIVVLEKEDFVPASMDAQAGKTATAVESEADETEKQPQHFSLKEVGKEAAGKAERELIRSVLYQTHWNRKRAADILQISYKALLYKIKKYDLNR